MFSLKKFFPFRSSSDKIDALAQLKHYRGINSSFSYKYHSIQFSILAMTTWACVSPNATILIMGTSLLLMFICYYAMDKKHLESSASSLTDAHNRRAYTALETKG